MTEWKLGSKGEVYYQIIWCGKEVGFSHQPTESLEGSRIKVILLMFHLREQSLDKRILKAESAGVLQITRAEVG